MSSIQSTGESNNYKSSSDSNNVIEVVNQLRLKRESKTLPQLHQNFDFSSPTAGEYFSQTNPSSLKQNLRTANEEIKQLKQELNLKNNQLSQLLKELSSKSNKNPNDQKQKAKQKRTTAESSVSPHSHIAQGILARNDNKAEQQRRAMSQPNGPTLQQDKEREEMKRSIRASKKNGNNERGGGTA